MSKLVWYVWKGENIPSGFVIRAGNKECGLSVTKEELKSEWSKWMRASKDGKSFGDVSILYDGNLIRSIINANERLLDKEIEYPCIYKKYKQ